MKNTEYLIIGGGPTGIGAALRLEQAGADWLLVDSSSEFGGLASTFKDEQGFLWDIGGHVQFSHYKTFDRFMEQALGADGWLEHERESWVWIKKRFVPYPFQNNLHRLPPEDRWKCVEGLIQAADAVERSKLNVEGRMSEVGGRKSGNDEQRTKNKEPAKPSTFEDWIYATFGTGIAELFMLPYNFKVWALPPAEMDYNWIGERVSVPDIKAVIRSVCLEEDAVSWGPNNLFRFPRYGGTGAIWNSLGRQLPEDLVRLGCAVISIDGRTRRAELADGSKISYGRLISTMPLDKLLSCVEQPISGGEGLRFSATNVVGVGLSGQPPEHLKTKCWMYFPEDDSPYYRVTVFSNYSPNNVPQPGRQWSLMTETSESTAKPVNHKTLITDTVHALVEDGLITNPDEVVSTVHRHFPQGYPTPFLNRDKTVDTLREALEKYEIFSRGRFGAWKYEVANQDHSFMQGWECAGRLLRDAGPEAESTLHRPGWVNGRRND